MRWEIGLELELKFYREGTVFVVAERMPKNKREGRRALVEYRKEGYLACGQHGWILIGWDRVKSPRPIDMRLT